MSDKLKQFEEKVRNAENAPLVDSLIEHAKKMMDDMEYYEAVKIVRAEIIKRLETNNC